MQPDNPYSLELNQRRRLLADAGFARDEHHIWSHADGRSAGEGVLTALTDAAFCRFLKIDIPPPPPANEG
jgi:hypothetical protein